MKVDEVGLENRMLLFKWKMSGKIFGGLYIWVKFNEWNMLTKEKKKHVLEKLFVYY